MKKVLLLFIAACCFGLFAACGGNDTETKNFTTVAEEFTEMVYSGDYAGAMTYVDPDYAGDLNEAALEQIAEGTESVYGEFQKITGMEPVALSDFAETMNVSLDNVGDLSGIKVLYESVAFEKGEMGIYLMFNGVSRRVCSLTVCGTEALDGETAENGGVSENGDAPQSNETPD